MIASVWTIGLLRRRGLRLLTLTVGIAVAVALLGSIAVFLSAAKATMTSRSAAQVAIDWQVQVVDRARADEVMAAVRSQPGTSAVRRVDFVPTTGLTASTAQGAADRASASTQTTGPGLVLGLPPDYRAVFPAVLRPLAGRPDGALLAQQTAANLHAVPGDQVTIARGGLPPVTVTVDGIVALPTADTVFQAVGAPPGAQPAAPPDNVVLLPTALWQSVWTPTTASAPDPVSTQIHTVRSHDLPPDPAAAYTVATRAARNLEVRTAGAGVVGDNLAAALDRARSDAAYAQVLFVFLGAPGAVLAGLLTAAVSATGRARRRREQAVLRLRGADTRTLVRLAASEALVIGVGAGALGLGAAALLGRLGFGSASLGSQPADAVGWAVAALVVALAITVATVLVPAWRDARSITVAAGRARGVLGTVAQRSAGILGVCLLAGAVTLTWLSTRNGYQIVLAPEGGSTISVSYWSFAAPALLWAGSAILAWRLFDGAIRRGRSVVAAVLRPVCGPMATTAATIAARRSRVLSRAMVLLALASAFAVSTAVFNATYRAQAETDAKLTNGADVTLSAGPQDSVPALSRMISQVQGVRGVEMLDHRFAYVGADLQDLYGVDPATIDRATTVTDQYVQGGTARELLDRLRTAPDSVLVSAETVTDYQLAPGDTVNLRLPDTHPGAPPGSQVTVPFHYAGIVTEFPTAPKDSFLVANSGYVAAATGGAGSDRTLLVDTGGQHSTAVADQLRSRFGPSARVSDIATTRTRIGSSLTAVDLAGLTRVELGFALVLAMAAGGLVLALDLTERRRTLALAHLLGARRSALRRLAGGEAVLLALAGLIAGPLVGWAVAETLVAVLSGVFDPPPTALTVPWSYLVGAAVLMLLPLIVVSAFAPVVARRRALTVARET